MRIASERLSDEIASMPPGGGRPASLSLRYALRELRGGLRGFYVFITCIALGVMAISGVGSIAASLRDGLAREGRTLLGGDVAFALFQREAKPAEVAFLHSRGQVSVAATSRVMARTTDGRLALVELKAVDDAYPLLGELTLRPKLPLADLLAERDGAFGAAVDPTLLARLDLKLGDVVTVGEARFQIRSVVEAEPDKLAGGIGLGPRFLVGEAGLRATGLIQPGSLIRWVYRVKLPDNADDDRAAAALIDDARKAVPEAGWEIRSRANASPQLERTIDRFTQFLTLVGLAALLVGGVGVANAVKSHIDRRLDVIAAFKALGATGRNVFSIYLTQVVVLAGLGSVIGLAAGAALPYVIVGLFGKILPLPVVPALHFDELALSFVYGLLTALAFGLWPLGRVHDVPVAALFRDVVSGSWHRPRWRYVVLMAAVIAALIAVAIGLAYDKRIAAVFVASSIAVFLLLRAIASGLMALARRMPRSRITMLRLAITNIYRPGALTPSVVLSLGLGLAVLGVKADDLKPSHDTEWVLQSDRGLTYTGEIPKGSKIIEGEWWGADYQGPPLVSIEKKIADGLRLKLGDEIVVNLLGRDIQAHIGNMRNIDWQGLGINFVLVFSPNAFKGAPHSHVATLTEANSDPAGDARIIKQVADAFPMVTSVRVREALETIGTVVSNLALAIRGASAVTLISAILVLGGALAAGHRHRVYDAVILKTLGATRVRLLGAYALEYLMIGLATAIFGVIAGSVAAWLIVTRLMTLSYVWQAGSAAGVVAAALVVTVGLGLAGTLLALNQKPATVLRNL